MSMNSLVIISDLHIGSSPLDDCDEELEGGLVSFLNRLCSKGATVELVINGDFLDFAQAAPWKGAELESETSVGIPLCFTEEQSVTKLEAITQEHKSIFKALGEFLLFNSSNRLVIIPGNHDADFFWPRVRAVFENKVCGGSFEARERLHFHLEQVYLSPRYPKLWVEHGNQYDPLNSFYVDEYDSITGSRIGKSLYWSRGNPPIFMDHEGYPRLYECTGTRFLIKFMNSLDADYPFVDNIKPLSKFLNLFGASALTGGYGPLKASLAVYGMFRYLTSIALNYPSELLGLERGKGEHLSTLLLGVFEGLSKDKQRTFRQKLSGRGFNVERPITMYLKDAASAELLLTFLSENLDLLDGLPQTSASYLSLTGEANYLSLVKGFNIDETSKLIRAARKVLDQNSLDGVVMGHTHERVDDFLTLKYLNTGSWTRYYNFESKRLPPWSVLQENSYKLFPYQLNYVEIVPDRAEPIRMITHMEKGGD